MSRFIPKGVVERTEARRQLRRLSRSRRYISGHISWARLNDRDAAAMFEAGVRSLTAAPTQFGP